MNARRWVHLLVTVLPVVILTVFNVLGIKPMGELLAALSAMTMAGASIAGYQTMHAQVAPASPAPVRKMGSTRKKVRPHGAANNPVQDLNRPPSRAAGHDESDRIP